VCADLRAHVRAALAWEPAVRLDREDAVHKMRVSVRRLRSSLRTFGPLLDPTELDRLEPELQWLAAELGAPRDAEVTRDHLLAAVGELPALFVRGPIVERVTDALDRRHRQAHEQLLGHLDSPRYLRLLDDMVGFAAAPPLTGESATPVRAVVPPLMRSAWRKLAKRVRRALEQPPGPEQDQLLHAARKAAKQARYAAEACERAHGEPAATLARQAEAIQELLGAHQDAVVAQHVLLSLADDAYALADDTTTYGVLIGAEVARADNLRRELAPAWREANRRRHRQWLEH
jgi:CHAD domain-containing protein